MEEGGEFQKVCYTIWEQALWLCRSDKYSFGSAGCIGNEDSYKKRQRSAASWDALFWY